MVGNSKLFHTVHHLQFLFSLMLLQSHYVLINYCFTRNFLYWLQLVNGNSTMFQKKLQYLSIFAYTYVYLFITSCSNSTAINNNPGLFNTTQQRPKTDGFVDVNLLALTNVYSKTFPAPENFVATLPLFRNLFLKTLSNKLTD